MHGLLRLRLGRGFYAFTDFSFTPACERHFDLPVGGSKKIRPVESGACINLLRFLSTARIIVQKRINRHHKELCFMLSIVKGFACGVF